jgi:hypothetical protein
MVGIFHETPPASRTRDDGDQRPQTIALIEPRSLAHLDVLEAAHFIEP